MCVALHQDLSDTAQSGGDQRRDGVEPQAIVRDPCHDGLGQGLGGQRCQKSCFDGHIVAQSRVEHFGDQNRCFIKPGAEHFLQGGVCLDHCQDLEQQRAVQRMVVCGLSQKMRKVVDDGILRTGEPARADQVDPDRIAKDRGMFVVVIIEEGPGADATSMAMASVVVLSRPLRRATVTAAIWMSLPVCRRRRSRRLVTIEYLPKFFTQRKHCTLCNNMQSAVAMAMPPIRKPDEMTMYKFTLFAGAAVLLASSVVAQAPAGMPPNRSALSRRRFRTCHGS